MEKLVTQEIAELVEIAKSAESVTPSANIEPRVLKDIEVFIQTNEIKLGKKFVHNIVLYSLYRETNETLTRTEFLEGFGYFFPKTTNSQNGAGFKLSPKLSNKRKLNLTTQHLKEARQKYGKKAKDSTTEESAPIIGQETQSN